MATWEDLRKEARDLENQVDVKLVSFAKLGSSSFSTTTTDRSPLLSSAGDPQTDFDALSSELAAMLTRLAAVNEAMAEYAGRQPQSAAIHHTLQRHRDILHDYRHEYTKTKTNIETLLEREDLLSSVHRDIRDYRGSGGNDPRMDLLLRESESARNSERMIDDQISIALEARDTLANQRAAFKAVQTKLNDLSNRFPMINSLVQKINVQKRRDSIILGTVVGLCLTFLIWFAFA